MRELHRKQHQLLDRIAKRSPEAIVVGWNAEASSPIIRHPDGRRTIARPSGYETNYR